ERADVRGSTHDAAQDRTVLASPRPGSGNLSAVVNPTLENLTPTRMPRRRIRVPSTDQATTRVLTRRRRSPRCANARPLSPLHARRSSAAANVEIVAGPVPAAGSHRLGTANANVAPGPSFNAAQMRPPWLSTMARLTNNPMPIPPALVV